MCLPLPRHLPLSPAAACSSAMPYALVLALALCDECLPLVCRTAAGLLEYRISKHQMPHTSTKPSCVYSHATAGVAARTAQPFRPTCPPPPPPPTPPAETGWRHDGLGATVGWMAVVLAVAGAGAALVDGFRRVRRRRAERCQSFLLPKDGGRTPRDGGLDDADIDALLNAVGTAQVIWPVVQQYFLEILRSTTARDFTLTVAPSYLCSTRRSMTARSTR